MGLIERRMIQAMKTDTLPGRSREIEEICGQSVPYEVDWSSFESDAGALNFLDNVACHRVNMALRTIAVDEMRKQALRDGLKLIRLKNVPDAGQRHLSFEQGVLEMHAPWALGTQGMHGDATIREALLARL